MLESTQNRCALVTGSSRGIGAAIAKRLAGDGVSVVVHYNGNRAAAEAVAREIRSGGGAAHLVQGDLSTQGGAVEVVQAAFTICGGSVDILVNNAGVFEGGPLGTITGEQINHVLAVNFRACILATQEFARLTQSKSGRIVNITSIAARVPSGGGSLYAASKAAVESLTRSLATEMGPRGITVNAVAPGTTTTDMTDAGFTPEARTAIAKGTALGRFGEPEDIAPVVAFLCSVDAAWITGQVIGADGGMITGGQNLSRFAKAIRESAGSCGV